MTGHQAPKQPDKLWSGRFTEVAGADLNRFWSSIGFDRKLAAFDLRGSIAHARMLGATGIIALEESCALIEGLESLQEDLATGQVAFLEEDEDIHMNIERLLQAKIGSLAGKLHTARSRNDQVALDTHLYVRENSLHTIRLLARFQQTLWTQAHGHIDTLMPGYTHMQRAQPILFAHHLMAYFWMAQRDIERMQDGYRRANISPLGAGALAGTTFPIDRQQTSAELGFAGVYPNSMDAVSDRDYVVEHLAANALISVHLSRLCEEIVLWMSAEFGFVSLSDAFCSGSSMMPQKKNADLAELVRAKTGRVTAALMGMLMVLKGTPLAYNKDFQEDKEGLFDSVETVQASLQHITAMMAVLQVKKDRMAEAAQKGFLDATDAADYLAKRGVPFREAHEIIGKLVRICLESGRALKDLPLAELQRYHAAFAEDFYTSIALPTLIGLRQSEGGTAPSRVQEQLDKGRTCLAQTEAWIAEKQAVS